MGGSLLGAPESLPQALEASAEGASLCSKASFVLLCWFHYNLSSSWVVDAGSEGLGAPLITQHRGRWKCS